MVAHRTILASAPSPVNREGSWRWRDVARPPVSADEVGRATSDCFRTPTPMAVMAKTGTDGDRRWSLARYARYERQPGVSPPWVRSDGMLS